MRSFTRSDNWNHLVRYRSLQKKSGPRNAFRPRLPNWQFFGLSPPAQAPVLGSTTETNASGLSHWIVAGLSHARDWIVFVQRYAGNHAGVLRAAALNDAVSVGRIRRAQDRKWQAAMPEHGAGDLPSVQRSGQDAIPEFDRQLINVLGCEVVPHVVVAGTVLAAKLARQRRKNGSGGEWQESAV